MDDVHSDPDTFVSAEQFAHSQTSHTSGSYESQENEDTQLPVPIADIHNSTQLSPSHHMNSQHFSQNINARGQPSTRQFVDASTFMWGLGGGNHEQDPDSNDGDLTDILTQDNVSVASHGDICGTFLQPGYAGNHQSRLQQTVETRNPNRRISVSNSRYTHMSESGRMHTDDQNSHHMHTITKDNTDIAPIINQPGNASAYEPFGRQQDLNDYDPSTVFDPSITDGNFTLTMPHQNPPTTHSSRVERTVLPKIDEDLPQVSKQKIQEASLGLSSFELNNPFCDKNQPTIYPETVRLYSKGKTIPEDELSALHELTSRDNSRGRVLRRFFETLAFHNIQLENCKDIEVNLAKSHLEDEKRRASILNNTNVSLIDSLVGELDRDRARIADLERMNSDLNKDLNEANRKVSGFKQFYLNFNQELDLSGDIEAVLEQANDGVAEYCEDIVAECKTHKDRVKDANEQVAKLQDALDKSKEQVATLRRENHSLQHEVANPAVSQEIPPSPVRVENPTVSANINLQCKVKDLEDIVNEQKDEISHLEKRCGQAESKKKNADDTCLNLNIENNNLRRERDTLRTFKRNTEKRCGELEQHLREERAQHQTTEKKMTDTIIAHSNNLAAQELQIELLSSQVNAKDEALVHMKEANMQLENHVNNLSNSAIEKAKEMRNTSGTQDIECISIFKSTIETYRRDVNKSHALLKKRADEVENLKREAVKQEEQVLALQKECHRLKCSLSLRDNVGSYIPNAKSSSGKTDNNQVFLRRLSMTLSKHVSGDAELVKQLSDRVQKLGEDLHTLESENNELHHEADSRERSMHTLRSEMQAEISTLKAEIAQLCNRAERAETERKEVEARYVALIEERNNEDLDSTGELTFGSMSFSRRRSNNGSEFSSRRASMRSSIVGDETNYFDDPFIVAAIESVKQLISAKDGISARYQALKDKITNILNEMRSQDISSHPSRSLIIESRDLLEELLNMLGMQGSIIDKLRSGPLGAIAETEDTLPMINELHEHLSTHNDGARRVSYQNHQVGHDSQPQVSPAAEFLSSQLEETRGLYKEKLKVIAEMSGIVRDLENDVVHIRTERDRLQVVLGELQGDYEGFVGRLSALTNVEPAPVAVEVAIERLLQNASTTVTQGNLDGVVAITTAKMLNLAAQKRILCHFINIYRTQYRLDIFANTSERSTPTKRFRAAVYVVITLMKLKGLSVSSTKEELPIVDISSTYEVPPPMLLTISYGGNCPPLMDAVTALNTVPRLEKLIQQREREYVQLQSSLAALQSVRSSEPRARPQIEDTHSAFNYDKDIVERKNELSRRLVKAMKEKEELETRLSAERRGRHTAESKVSRYTEKVSVLRKRIIKLEGNANAKEMAYKAAIRYVKGKADKALESTRNADENIDPSFEMRALKENNMKESNNYDHVQENCRNQLFAQYEKAMGNLQKAGPAHPAYDEMKQYVIGLEKVIERIDAKGLRRNITRDDTESSRICLT